MVSELDRIFGHPFSCAGHVYWFSGYENFGSVCYLVILLFGFSFLELVIIRVWYLIEMVSTFFSNLKIGEKGLGFDCVVCATTVGSAS